MHIPNEILELCNQEGVEVRAYWAAEIPYWKRKHLEKAQAIRAEINRRYWSTFQLVKVIDHQRVR